MKFTKEEISLCKQVAEKHRKEICKGDCVAVRSYGDLSGKTEYKVILVDFEFLHKSLDVCFPLWTISDCLEFLNQGNSFKTELYNTRWNWYCKTKRYEIGAKEYFARGKTPLEACLKAVLAVLEEKK